MKKEKNFRPTTRGALCFLFFAAPPPPPQNLFWPGGLSPCFQEKMFILLVT